MPRSGIFAIENSIKIRPLRQPAVVRLLFLARCGLFKLSRVPLGSRQKEAREIMHIFSRPALNFKRTSVWEAQLFCTIMATRSFMGNMNRKTENPTQSRLIKPNPTKSTLSNHPQLAVAHVRRRICVRFTRCFPPTHAGSCIFNRRLVKPSQAGQPPRFVLTFRWSLNSR